MFSRIPRWSRLTIAGLFAQSLVFTGLLPAEAAEPESDVEVVASSSDRIWHSLDWSGDRLYASSWKPAIGSAVEVIHPATGAVQRSTQVDTHWPRTGDQVLPIAVADDGAVFLAHPTDTRWDSTYGVTRLSPDGTALTPAVPPDREPQSGFNSTAAGLDVSPDGKTVYFNGKRWRTHPGYEDYPGFWPELASLPVPLPTDQNSAATVAGMVDHYAGEAQNPPYDATPATDVQAFGQGSVLARGGAVYVADNNTSERGGVINRVDLTTRTVTTVVGMPWDPVYAGANVLPLDGMNARTPYFYLYGGLAVDRRGNVFFTAHSSDVSEGGANVWMMRASDQTLHRIAGGGTEQPANGVAPTQLRLEQPRGLTLDPDGNLYVATDVDDDADFVADRSWIVKIPGVAAADSVPSAPTALSASSTAGALAVTFSAPVDDGGRPVTSYTVTAHRGGAADVVKIVTQPGTMVVSGLADGEQYDVSVSATNALGTGPAATLSVTVGFSAALTADRTAVAAGDLVTLDATGSRATPGATYEFYCGDSHDPTGPATSTATAGCRYPRQSPADGGWLARVVMRDPLTSATSTATTRITVAPKPGTVEDSAAFPGAPDHEVSVNSDGSLGDGSCSGGNATCVTVAGTTIRLAAGKGTFSPGSKVQIYRGDEATLQSELGANVMVNGGFAITWTPRTDLAQPLIVTIPKPAGAGQRIAPTTALTGIDFGGFLAGLAQGIADGTTKVVQTVGAGLSAAANTISSIWAGAAQTLTQPNGQGTNDVLVCRSVTRTAQLTTCNGTYTLIEGVSTSRIATLNAGGYVVAAGGANVVAAGGGNVVAAGGLNVIAAGGLNLRNPGATVVAAGGANVVAAGGANVVAAGGGNVVAAGGANVVAAGGGNLTFALTGDPGFGFVEPARTTPPTVTATLDPPRPLSGVYPAGTTVRVHLHATAASGATLKSINFSIDGAGHTPYTIVPGNEAVIELGQAGTSTIMYGALDDHLNEAAAQSLEVEVARNAQTIDFHGPGRLQYGDAAVPLSASASSGLPVSFDSGTPSRCSIVDEVLVVKSAGTCTVIASQEGDGTFLAAPQVHRQVTVDKAVLVVTAPDVAMTAGQASPAVLPVYQGFFGTDSEADLDTLPSCAVDVSALRTSCSGGQDDSYSFDYRSGALTVNKAGQKVSITVPAVVGYAQTQVAVKGASTSGLPVTLSAGPATVCGMRGTTLLVHHAGICTVGGVQAGGISHEADRAQTRVTVHPARLTVRATDAQRPKKGALPEAAPLFTGFVRGDNILSLTRMPSCRAIKAPARTICAGASARDYAIDYRPGRLTGTKSGYAFVTASTAYLRAGTRASLPMKVAGGKSVSITIKGTPPVGMKAAANKRSTKVRLTGTPRVTGAVTFTAIARKGLTKVAVQRLTIYVVGPPGNVSR